MSMRDDGLSYDHIGRELNEEGKRTSQGKPCQSARRSTGYRSGATAGKISPGSPGGRPRPQQQKEVQLFFNILIVQNSTIMASYQSTRFVLTSSAH